LHIVKVVIVDRGGMAILAMIVDMVRVVMRADCGSSGGWGVVVTALVAKGQRR
jgi:hypothetical protein